MPPLPDENNFSDSYSCATTEIYENDDDRMNEFEDLDYKDEQKAFIITNSNISSGVIIFNNIVPISREEPDNTIPTTPIRRTSNSVPRPPIGPPPLIRNNSIPQESVRVLIRTDNFVRNLSLEFN